MKVLVTGATGYVGSVLTHKLLNKGYEVIGVDFLMYGGESILGIFNHTNFRFYKADIRNIESIKLKSFSKTFTGASFSFDGKLVLDNFKTE